MIQEDFPRTPSPVYNTTMINNSRTDVLNPDLVAAASAVNTNLPPPQSSSSSSSPSPATVTTVATATATATAIAANPTQQLPHHLPAHHSISPMFFPDPSAGYEEAAFQQQFQSMSLRDISTASVTPDSANQRGAQRTSVQAPPPQPHPSSSSSAYIQPQPQTQHPVHIDKRSIQQPLPQMHHSQAPHPYSQPVQLLKDYDNRQLSPVLLQEYQQPTDMMGNLYGYYAPSGVYSQNPMYPGAPAYGPVHGNNMVGYSVPQMKDNRKTYNNYYATTLGSTGSSSSAMYTPATMGEDFYGIPQSIQGIPAVPMQASWEQIYAASLAAPAGITPMMVNVGVDSMQQPPQTHSAGPRRTSMGGSSDRYSDRYADRYPSGGKGRHTQSDENVPRSKIMEEFRNAKNRNFTFQDIVNHFVEFSRDQYGSRFIQQKLESATDEEKTMVFDEVFPTALELMTDVFGNYVIQKLFEHGLPQQKKALIGVLKGHVLSLTLQTYGCRVIQKALDYMEAESQISVCNELEGHVMRCVQDQNGNHVVQKCIEKIAPQQIQFILQSFIGHILEMATHSYGCRVIQRILEHCPDSSTKGILDEILTHAQELVTDQYGNYVVQHVLQKGHPRHRSAVISQLRTRLGELSMHKYASNVVEKCFQAGSRKEKQDILEEIIGTGSEDAPLFNMMKDRFGNYVVQKIIDLADESQRKMLIDAIKPHISSLRRFTYGKHIITHIENTMQ